MKRRQWQTIREEDKHRFDELRQLKYNGKLTVRKSVKTIREIVNDTGQWWSDPDSR